MTTTPTPSPNERQLQAVIEGVTRSLTNFSNVYERMRRHYREDHRQALDSREEIKAMIYQAKEELKEKMQDVLEDSIRTIRILVCWND